MEFRPSPEAEAFRAEVREFLRENWTPEQAERVKQTGTMHDWKLHRAFAERGWVRAAMPKSMGGQGRGPEELATLFQEFEFAGAPYDGMSVSMMIAGIVQQVGSAFHREQIIPKVLSGESLLCLGYSEPGSGSDVAAAITRAERDGDGWVINGQKMWTTLAEESEWCILLTRTNTEVKKHRGLTFFLVPMDTPGIQVQEIKTLGGKRSNATYWDDVRIDDRWRLGEVDGGWDVMLVALAYERGVMGGISDGVRLLDAARSYAESATRADGTRVIDDPVVRERLVRTAIDNEVADLLGARAAWIAASGGLPGVEGSQAKMFATETFTRATSWFVDMLGPEGALQRGVPGAPANGFLEHSLRYSTVTTLYGGTSEIQRNNIAERGLGLPRAR
jgi:alkylation response protein AidB-like acyl-CoA dehydrogenase